MKPGRLIFLTALAVSGGWLSQGNAQEEIDYFADEFPTTPPKRVVLADGKVQPVDAAKEFRQTLHFQNGRRLRGALAEITPDEILWRHRDAETPLRFPRAEVRKVLLVPSEQMPNPSYMRPGSKPAAPLPATVKLPGADWLRGPLTSADGQSFALALKGGATCALSRAQIEWLHFDAKPAPAYSLGRGKLGLEGWLTSGTPRVEMEDDAVTLNDIQWLGRALATPSRFEVAFEIPEESEEGLRVWLQPFNPQPNSYSTGTVQFRLGRKSLQWVVFVDNIQPNDVALPAEAQAETGPVRYRIFYDGYGETVAIVRNDRKLGEWSLKPPNPPPGMEGRQQRLPRGLCFNREERGDKNPPLRFRRLAVLPWDGQIEKGDGVAAADQLSLPSEANTSGQLEAVREKELVFAGKTVPVVAETLVRFPGAPMPAFDAEALLSFGEQGEVGLADLRVREGTVRGRAAFTPAMELPASALQSISFASGEAAVSNAGDLLVFRNGDELPGALVSATAGAPLRWRLASGQELDFQTARLAGVRLTALSEAKPAGALELRTGERICGELAALDGEKLRWRNALLGELSIDRAHLWRLYPGSAQAPRTGDQNPANWLSDSPKTKRLMQYSRVRPRSLSWLAFDGRFIARSRESSSGEQVLGPFCELPDELDRFEMRVETASLASNFQGSLNISLMAAGDNSGGVGLNLSPYDMSVYVQNPKSRTGGGNREFQMRDKLGQNVRQLSLRAFVDRRTGTMDLFLNGYSFGRIGQTAAERVPGIGQTISFDTYTHGQARFVITGIWVAPWNGELPRSGPAAPTTLLVNGDAAQALPAALADGRFHLESEIGPLDLAAEKVLAVEFGGELQPARAPARLRLTDGSALLVEHFAWATSELTARHAIFGELRLPASAVSEIVCNPAPAREPQVLPAKKIAQGDQQEQ